MKQLVSARISQVLGRATELVLGARLCDLRIELSHGRV